MLIHFNKQELKMLKEYQEKTTQLRYTYEDIANMAVGVLSMVIDKIEKKEAQENQ